MNLLERIANDPVPYAHRIILWVVALVLLFFIFGCATVPACNKFEYFVHQQDGEVYLVLDQTNAAALAIMLDALNKGACRLGE